ncbi:MAG: hypothetical protein CL920_22340 [Deltaproteobacteria bacterium]|nr:hypothetical protein [Deltaproteobacteria bacterium]MBU51438.1 hypothetical protein [Deltaproteobacteria bacterium]
MKLGSGKGVAVAKASELVISVENLKRRCKPSSLPESVMIGETEEQLFTPLAQSRALSAIDFGLNVQGKGYNIFVMGPGGAGKTSTVLKLLKEKAADLARPQDILFVYNFKDPDCPRPILVPNGMASMIETEIEHAIRGLAKSIFRTLFDEAFTEKASKLSERAEEKAVDVFSRMEEIANKHGLGLEREGEQFLVVPLIDGEPIEPDVFEELSLEQQETLQEQISAFQNEAAPLIKAQREQERERQESLTRLERWAIQGLVDTVFEALKTTLQETGEEILSYIDGMHEYLMNDYRELLLDDNEESAENGEEAPLPLPYRVNILKEFKEDGVPVIVEKEPTAEHLFGYLEYQEEYGSTGMGGLGTDHMLVRAGSLHRANGGFLILQASDLIRRPHVWDSLKQALRHKEIRIHDATSSPEKPRIRGMIRPLETPLRLKIVLVGSAESYYMLMHEDEDFSRVFKVKAEFETWLSRTTAHESAYCHFLQRLCEEENLLKVSKEGLAALVEESSREAGSQNKLSTSIVSGIDLLTEADYWARKEGHDFIELADVQKALSFRDYRHESLEQTVLESIEKGFMMIDTDGDVVGQLNGLLVYIALDHQFGVPAKITARTYAGVRGVMNIDREAQLSGEIHDKGTMILVGLLGGICAQEHPLAFNASITFEQNYGEIEGDSASCAEFFALLSSLAEVPIHQGIAVTGSINQQGLVQPIGGVNEKIEGMFKICKKRGLTGRQGVIIPEPNVEHLMLRDEVIEAVEAGQFHIWAIKHVFEGIEILMNIEAGDRDDDGVWTEGSLFQLVQKRLDHFYQISKESRGAL